MNPFGRIRNSFGGGVRAARALALGALALAGALNKASAQQDIYAEGFFTHGVRTGYYLDTNDPIYDPVYVPLERWSLVPRVTLTATREDNLFLSAEKESGTVIRLIPGALLIWGRPESNHLYADAGVVFLVSDSSDRLDEEPSYMFALGGVYQTMKSQVQARGGYRRLENADMQVGARIVKSDYTANAGVDHRVSAKTSLGVLGGLEFHRFDADRYVDYDRFYGGGRIYREMTPMSEVFVQGGVGRDDLDTGAGGYGDADFYDVAVGIRGKPTPKTSATGRVGYQWRTFDSPEIEDVQHWTASLGAETNPRGYTTFSTELLADLRPAIASAGSTSIDQRWTVGVSRRLFVEQLRGRATVFVGRVDYRSPAREAGPDDRDTSFIYDRRRDDYWGYTLGLDWWAHKNFSVGASYAYVENQAAQNADEITQRAASYDSGVWTLRLSWNY